MRDLATRLEVGVKTGSKGVFDDSRAFDQRPVGTSTTAFCYDFQNDIEVVGLLFIINFFEKSFDSCTKLLVDTGNDNAGFVSNFHIGFELLIFEE